MSDEFSETDEWPVPQGWMRHQAETGLAPPQNGTLRPNDDRTVWRDRGVRIAALETENTELRADALRLDEAIGRVLALAYDARRNSGGSFTANVDVLSLERALEGSALLAPSPASTTGEAPRGFDLLRSPSADEPDVMCGLEPSIPVVDIAVPVSSGEAGPGEALPPMPYWDAPVVAPSAEDQP